MINRICIVMEIYAVKKSFMQYFGLHIHATAEGMVTKRGEGWFCLFEVQLGNIFRQIMEIPLSVFCFFFLHLDCYNIVLQWITRKWGRRIFGISHFYGRFCAVVAVVATYSDNIYIDHGLSRQWYNGHNGIMVQNWSPLLKKFGAKCPTKS